MLWTYDMMSFQKIYNPTQLANAMKLVRQQNGWTQSELAKKIGIKQATISNFENNPDNTTLTRRRRTSLNYRLAKSGSPMRRSISAKALIMSITVCCWRKNLG